MTDKSTLAFPLLKANGYSNDGMTLRDYFAGQVITGLINNELIDALGPDRFPTVAAQTAYQIADAMIKERSK